MKNFRIPIKSEKPVQLIDITDKVNEVIVKQGMNQGLILIRSQHTTAGITINEKCEKLEKDFEDFVAELLPLQKKYHHNQETIDGRENAHSHLFSYLLGSSETVPVENGKLTLGGWQRIFFAELDGPRPLREVLVTVIDL